MEFIGSHSDTSGLLLSCSGRGRIVKSHRDYCKRALQARDAPNIPQNLPIILLRISPEPSQLFLNTKPIILDYNFPLSLAEKSFCWVKR